MGLGDQLNGAACLQVSAGPVADSALCFRARLVCLQSVALSFIRFYECVGGSRGTSFTTCVDVSVAAHVCIRSLGLSLS